MQPELNRARENLKKKLMQNAHKTIKEILKTDLKGLLEIGLFGSVAKDDFNCRSDTDIYLLFNNNIPDRETKGHFRSIAEENNCDIIFLTKNDFIGNTDNHFIEKILEKRIVLWREDSGD